MGDPQTGEFKKCSAVEGDDALGHQSDFFGGKMDERDLLCIIDGDDN